MGGLPRRQGVLRAACVRAGFVVLGLVGGLLVAEGALQLGALYLRATGREQASAWGTNRRRIVCFGDSNVYGIFEKREDTYPQVLERLWNAATPAQPVEVLNLGFPGLNSSKIRKNFRDLMATLRPDLVLVLVGSNDINSVPVPLGGEDSAQARFEYVLWQHSRVYRLLHMLAVGLRGQAVEVQYTVLRPFEGVVRVGEVEFDLGGTHRMDPSQLPNWKTDLVANLRAMAADAAAVGAKMILLTYPSHKSLYGMANTVIASMTDLPVIDLTPRFTTLCPDGDCPEVFRRDQHPNANGYRLMAAIVFNHLREAGVAPSTPRDAASAGLDDGTRRYLRQLGYLQ